MNNHNYRNMPEKLFRVFLIGCPRSGTTLLQSMLAAHPMILSLPETHFFPNIVSRCKWMRVIGLTQDIRKSSKILKDIGCSNEEIPHGLRAIFLKSYVEVFISFLDQETRENNKNCWVEKTPRNLHHVKFIERFVPKARFIHIIRDGRDVVASLYEVTNKYPHVWGGARNIEQCVNRWTNDIQISLKLINKKNHFLVKYEDLLHNTENVLSNLCKFLYLPYSKKMIDDYGFAYRKVKEEAAEWTNNAGNKLIKTRGLKYNTIFNRKQRSYIENKISEAGLSELSK